MKSAENGKSSYAFIRKVAVYTIISIVLLALILRLATLIPSFQEEIRETKFSLATLEILLEKYPDDDVKSILSGKSRKEYVEYIWHEYERTILNGRIRTESFLNSLGFKLSDTLNDIRDYAEKYAEDDLLLRIDSHEFIVYARFVADNQFHVVSEKKSKEDRSYAALIIYIYLLNARDGSIDESDVSWINQKRFEKRSIESFWIQVFNNQFVERIPELTHQYLNGRLLK